MLSEALDITVESRDDDLWLILSGRFNKEQVQSIKLKIEGFVADGNSFIVVDMEHVVAIHESVPLMFLDLLNLIQGNNGTLKFVFKNNIVSEVFTQYKNIFSIYSDQKKFSGSGILDNMRRQGIILSRKTGIRLSIPVALLILFIIVMWFISLAYIINLQNRQIRKQESLISSYEEINKKQTLKIDELKERLLPMEQLGITETGKK